MWRALLVGVAACAAATGGAWAGDEAWQYKLTVGNYRLAGEANALDVNLRAAHGDQTGWLGWYQQASGRSGSPRLRQARAGFEQTLDGDTVKTVVSATAASGGYLGLGFTSEIGGDAGYGIAGFSRTNLRNYVNLNFDPNDAITLGLGSRAIPGLPIAVFQVRDDRLGTQQANTHLLVRYQVSAQLRWTVDLADKRGLLDNGDHSHQTALSLTLDHPPWFARLAVDPRVNFTPLNMVRLSYGLRL